MVDLTCFRYPSHLEKTFDRRFELISKHGEITKGNELRSKNSLSEGYDKREIKVKKKFFMKLRKLLRVPKKSLEAFKREVDLNFVGITCLRYRSHLEKTSDRRFELISKHGEIAKGNGLRLKKLADGCDNALL